MTSGVRSRATSAACSLVISSSMAAFFFATSASNARESSVGSTVPMSGNSFGSVELRNTPYNE